MLRSTVIAFSIVTLFPALFISLAATAHAGKPAKPAPPPPPPPAIKFQLKLIRGVDGDGKLGLHNIGDMNDHGDIVGTYSLPTGPVWRVYVLGEVCDPHALLVDEERGQWNLIRVSAINNEVEITGRAIYLGEERTFEKDGRTIELHTGAAYLYLMNCITGEFEPLYAAELAGTTLAVSEINDEGDICGHDSLGQKFAYVMPRGSLAPTFLYERPGDANPLSSSTTGINNDGQVIGGRNGKAYRYTPALGGVAAQWLELGRIETGKNIADRNWVAGINKFGQIVGYANAKAGRLAYRYTDGVGMFALTTVDSYGLAINDQGDVLYQNSITDNGALPGIFVRLEQPGGTSATVNLRTAGVVQGDATEVTRFRTQSLYPRCINNSRVVSGQLQDYQNPGAFVFVLTPLP
jgi:probable HAF family extracellular repeat protein